MNQVRKIQVIQLEIQQKVKHADGVFRNISLNTESNKNVKKSTVYECSTEK